MRGSHQYFALKTPCDECPFRTDITFYLNPDRKQEIADALLGDQTFACHKTVIHDEDDGEAVCGNPGERHCAGAAIMLEKIDRPNQLMRIGERIGMYDRTAIDMQAPVFDTFDDWIDS
jgi:hypothetical protein